MSKLHQGQPVLTIGALQGIDDLSTQVLRPAFRLSA
jgi:hypothetical protein